MAHKTSSFRPCTRVFARVALALVVLFVTDFCGALAKPAIKINEHWMFMDLRDVPDVNNLDLSRDYVTISPIELGVEWITERNIDPAAVHAISDRMMFQVGWARRRPRGTRLVMIALPRLLCADGRITIFPRIGYLPIEIIVDGNSLGTTEIYGNCGSMGVLRERDVGANAMSRILSAFQRGRQAHVWLLDDRKNKLFAYRINLTGFTEAIRSLPR